MTGLASPGPFATCPDCGARTEPVSDGWSTLMYCGVCDAHWRFTMGWVSRVARVSDLTVSG
jgi:hypothetical protein